VGVTLHQRPAPQRDASWPQRLIRPLAWATLVANIVIVVTGAAVRLTASGLGCPTWPRCTAESFVPHGELGIHGVIEFGNRMVTFVLAAVAVATFVVALRIGRRSVVRLTFLLGLVVPAQAMIGGVTVLTGLNPWVVAFHLLVSMAIIGLAVLLLRRLYEGDGPATPTVSVTARRLVVATFATAWAVLYVGTVVTGSGPHAGDVDAPRNGLDPQLLSHVHAALVYLLVALTVAVLVAFHRTGAPAFARRAAAGLLVLELLQGGVGFVQYFTDLPEVLVGVHLLGAALVSASVTWLLLATRGRGDLAAGGRPGSP